jgi:hypothetical protein
MGGRGDGVAALLAHTIFQDDESFIPDPPALPNRFTFRSRRAIRRHGERLVLGDTDNLRSDDGGLLTAVSFANGSHGPLEGTRPFANGSEGLPEGAEEAVISSILF